MRYIVTRGRSGATVRRYVPTYLQAPDAAGVRLRALMLAAHGDDTFDTAEAAQQMLMGILTQNAASTVRSVWGADPQFAVRSCECWENSHDPCGVYFDEE